jgi:hypothetical protein
MLYILLHLITLSDTHRHRHTHTHTHTPTHTLSRTLLDEGSACCKDLYLTTHNIHIRQTSIPQVEIQTYSPTKQVTADIFLDCMTTNISGYMI